LSARKTQLYNPDLRHPAIIKITTLGMLVMYLREAFFSLVTSHWLWYGFYRGNYHG